ncbi:MAG: hypothetical protein P8L18_09990 [Verrucomicrobiota bacterium]|nr:hypothetical protein [Verrucomicrobiota bacterium]
MAFYLTGCLAHACKVPFPLAQARRISEVTHEKPLPEGIFKRVQMQAGDTAWPLSL